MESKQICQLLLSVLVIATVTRAGTVSTPIQNVYNGLLGLEKVLLNGQYNNEPIIPKSVTANSYNEILDLYQTLHNITTAFEAQATLTNNRLGSALNAVLDSVEDDACAMINEKIAGTIECSSFSDVKNLKLELDLFFMTKRAIELIERATRLSRESEAFLGALPCDEDGMPLDIIESLGLGVGCRNES